MPTLTIYRKNATPIAQQIAVGSPNQAQPLVLFPNKWVGSAYVSPDNVPEMLAQAKDLEARGVLGWHLKPDDSDPDRFKILGGLELSDGTTPNTTAAYYMNVAPGTVRMGAHDITYPGFTSVPILNSAASLKNDVDDPLGGNAAVADGNAIKMRWYLLREYFPPSDLELVRLFGVAGDEDLTATVGAVTDSSTGYPSDEQVDALFRARDEILIGQRLVIDKMEIGRSLHSRSGGTVTGSFYDLKEQETRQEAIAYIDKEIDHEDIAVGAGTNTSDFRYLNGIFAGASLQTLEPSDLASLTIELGQAGATNELFDAFDVGTGGANGLGLQDTTFDAVAPRLPGRPLIDYLPSLLFTGGANLDTATAGKWRVRIWYFPEPKFTVDDGVWEANTDENTL